MGSVGRLTIYDVRQPLLQSNPLSDRSPRHALRAVGLYLYLSGASIAILTLALWLSPFGRIAKVLLVLAAGYLVLKIGRRLFGRKDSPTLYG